MNRRLNVELSSTILMAVGIGLFLILCLIDRMFSLPGFLYILFTLIDMGILVYGAIGGHLKL